MSKPLLDYYNLQIKAILLLGLLIWLCLTGCSAKRLRLHSLRNYSPEQLTDLYQFQKERWPSLAALRVWFKAKIKLSGRKDYFRGALYYQKPGNIRLERWGFMNQLNGIVFSNETQTVLEIPSQSLYYIGSPKAFAGHFWGEDILPSELPYLLSAQPPNWENSVLNISREGKHLILHYPGFQFRIGFSKETRDVIYLAKHDLKRGKLWEVFYEKPVEFNGVRFMSKATLKIGTQTKVELQIQKITTNTKFKSGLFDPMIPPNAQIESLERTLSW